MKLRCVKNYKVSVNGFFKRTIESVRVEGLTEGKIYDGHAITVTSGDGNIGFGSVGSDAYFLIFDDNNEWTIFDLNHFEPALETK